ncbi:hypothetical protein MGN70_012001, partial [Eutypa lata]
MRFLSTTTLASTALLGQAMALYIEKTCHDITLDPQTEVLSASCNDREGVPHPNSFDLNTCLGWNSEDAAITYGKNFGDVCNDCYLEQRFLEQWEGIYTFVVCNCDGDSGKDYGL